MKIIETIYTYSKKKGAYPSNIVLKRDVTLEEAQKFVKEKFSDAVQTSPTTWTKKGMLGPGSITIK
jgi:hypothetical protein